MKQGKLIIDGHRNAVDFGTIFVVTYTSLDMCVCNICVTHEKLE